LHDSNGALSASKDFVDLTSDLLAAQMPEVMTDTSTHGHDRNIGYFTAFSFAMSAFTQTDPDIIVRDCVAPAKKTLGRSVWLRRFVTTATAGREDNYSSLQ
jgi:hypothetical protein